MPTRHDCADALIFRRAGPDGRKELPLLSNPLQMAVILYFFKVLVKLRTQSVHRFLLYLKYGMMRNLTTRHSEVITGFAQNHFLFSCELKIIIAITIIEK